MLGMDPVNPLTEPQGRANRILVEQTAVVTPTRLEKWGVRCGG